MAAEPSRSRASKGDRKRPTACAAQAPRREGAREEKEHQEAWYQGRDSRGYVQLTPAHQSCQQPVTDLHCSNLDDFEVSIFLTETSTRHSLLYKHKHFRDTTQTRLTSNSGRLTGATREVPIDIDEREQVEADVPVQIRQEDSDDDAPVVLDDIPSVSRVETSGRPKRRRRETGSANEDGNDCNGGEISNDDDGLFVTDDEHSSEDGRQPPSKRLREGVAEDEEQQDDKKKMAMDISYEGFSIYGRVLCLVVKKRETAGSKTSSAAPSSKTTQRGAPGGQAVMENWITSTQLPEAVIPDGPDAS